MTSGHTYETKADSQTWRADMVAKGEGLGRGMEGLGVWDEPIKTIIYKMDEQGPAAWHRELHSVSYDKLWTK